MKTRVSILMTAAMIVLLALGCAEDQRGSNSSFTGLGMSLGTLPRLSDAQTRSISPENFTGQKGAGGMAVEGTGANAARELGQGWKVSPSVRIKNGQTFTLAEIDGSGVIQHIWMTPTGNWRHCILRVYWDDEPTPSIEVPVGDFFANGWCRFAPVNSLAVCVNPGSGFNCYWPMPFRKSAKLTFENLGDDMTLYYQIDYALTDVPEDMGYLHAQFRRVNPLPDQEDYAIVDGIRGKGHYVGTYMCWGSNSPGWWGEGEIKYYIDGDTEWPTICGTGTEDYFCGSYGFVDPRTRQYMEYNTAYAGMPQVIKAEDNALKQPRFGLYRWHIVDPIRFESDLRVTIQALGWQSEGRYLPLKDDLSSVAFWYQTEPHAPMPAIPTKAKLTVQW